MSSSGAVVVVGSANQDLTTYTDRIPNVGETVLGRSFETSFGGKGANQAVAAANLKISDVVMVCRVGNDSFGSDILANFRHVGVKYDEEETTITRHHAEQPSFAHTGVAPIIVDTRTGDNMIICNPNANHALSPSAVKSAILKYNPSVVMVQLEIRHEAALEAMRVGKEVGAITILNPAPAPDHLDEDFYNYVDILIPNETELSTLCCNKGNDEESMAKTLLEKGIRLAVIVTLGARGAMIVSKDGRTVMVNAPADLPCNSKPVQDTVGAGDAFCGSIAAYLSVGLDLSDAATKACGIASMSVRKKGAQSSFPTCAELPDMLRVVSHGSPDVLPSEIVITFVTGNQKKSEEVKQILSKGNKVEFRISNRKIDVPELQGNTEDIAIEKCKMAAAQVGGPVLTEDTSLCFNALKGMPGPYIKWFLEKCGHNGLNDMLIGFDDKSGYAQTVVAFTPGPGHEVHIFDGRTDGIIVRPRGSSNFGWDPIFEPLEGNGKTYAEMESDEKNAISHRGRAFAKLREFLVSERDYIRETIAGKA